ncbi:hypothetical protein SETIT_1G114400v2 [Setaria italica]|uniref:Uncharacterized protein n=1 Tax=Setaria italica TaxID=4555 RepID=A0A368PJ92_SETIT|nr:hypothetical protein SETIT_1G114400v2 [Setaria italica]RCV05835.1 hypothetical protein SETIT_1G114400v2 [Setaria italica]RCV05836.1 hypothetical protein SETIT_1G114400v2 [Setaria italica]RCV05837.1 hypothetical protein SETIT_1G114400v2 [Setaria italica]
MTGRGPSSAARARGCSAGARPQAARAQPPDGVGARRQRPVAGQPQAPHPPPLPARTPGRDRRRPATPASRLLRPAPLQRRFVILCG